MRRTLLSASIVLAVGLPFPAYRAWADELAEIRKQIEEIRATYEAQLKALEARLEEAEARTDVNRRAAEADQAGPPSAAPPAELPPLGSEEYERPTATASAFNPALSVVLQGSVNRYSENPDSYALPGFELGEEAGLQPRGLTLDETEITASANIDPLFYGETTVAFEDNEGDTEVSVEEAFVDTLSLPAGLGLRFGRFYSDIGYLNRFHSHAWDFHDAPLANRAFLNKQYGDDGVRLSWLAPADLYLRIGGEALAGNQFPGGTARNTFGDSHSLFAELGGDLGISHSWLFGLSGLWVDAHDRKGLVNPDGEDGADNRFNGDSRLYIADFVWKWAPDGNSRERNLKFQTELFYRKENGPVTVSENTNQARVDYDGHQGGWYAQSVYQFMRRWRAGVRYDRLWSDNDLEVVNLGGFAAPADVIAATGLDDQGHDPSRWSAMVDWSPSEFSRLRLQYDWDQSRQGSNDNQWSLQYVMSLGAHGAHAF